MDAVTALSGSGPAYFFHIVKSMIRAGVEMGMEPHVAALLVKQTLLGSYHLMNAKEVDLDELIKGVASKGGTTEAALNYFNANNLDKILINGIKSAENRGKELAIIKNN
jgi:pyrroline-5-carboxylate reductase